MIWLVAFVVLLLIQCKFPKSCSLLVGISLLTMTVLGWWPSFIWNYTCRRFKMIKNPNKVPSQRSPLSPPHWSEITLVDKKPIEFPSKWICWNEIVHFFLHIWSETRRRLYPTYAIRNFDLSEISFFSISTNFSKNAMWFDVICSIWFHKLIHAKLYYCYWKIGFG